MEVVREAEEPPWGEHLWMLEEWSRPPLSLGLGAFGISLRCFVSSQTSFFTRASVSGLLFLASQDA